MAEWTILVFLNAKNDLESFAFPNFQQMAAIGSSPDVNIVVEMGRPKRHYTQAYGPWSKTLRFHVQKGMIPVESSAVEDLGDVNMGDPSSLRDFVQWGRAKYPATRTMLTVWNHGQGWRKRDIVPDGDELVTPGAIRYVSNDEDTGDKLYNRAIQDTLLDLLKGERLDIVAFDACLMAMVETAYALRGVADVMVGSEELEPGTGWNYERWLEPLVDARGSLDAAALGKQMVKAYEDEYGDLAATTLSAVDQRQVPTLAQAISGFAEAALPLLTPAHAGAFKAAREGCANYAPGRGLNSIDLGRYMEAIAGSSLDASVRQRADDVLSKLRGAVIGNYASAMRKGRFGSNGLAIYFPATRAAYQRDPDGAGYDPANQHYPVEFVEREKWATFLHRYWRLF